MTVGNGKTNGKFETSIMLDGTHSMLSVYTD